MIDWDYQHVCGSLRNFRIQCFFAIGGLAGCTRHGALRDAAPRRHAARPELARQTDSQSECSREIFEAEQRRDGFDKIHAGTKGKARAIRARNSGKKRGIRTVNAWDFSKIEEDLRWMCAMKT